MSALVQHPAGNGSSSPGSTITNTFVSNVTAGNTIIVVTRAIGFYRPMTMAVTDSLGNTYTQSEVTTDIPGSGDERIWIFYAKNIAGGACTVTATATSSTSPDRRDIDIYEVSGLDTSSPQEDTDAVNGSSSSPSAGSVTTAGGSFIIAAIQSNFNYGGALTVGSGWTIGSASGIWNRALYEYRIEGSGGTFSGTFGDAAAPQDFTGIIVAFKDAAAGSTITAAAGIATVSVTGGARVTASMTAAAGVATVFVVGSATGSIDLSGTNDIFAALNHEIHASKDVTFWLHDEATGALVATINTTTDSNGRVGVIYDEAIEAGVTYRLDFEFDTGEYGVLKRAAGG